jgi:D-3-phosphoglycerate dehydrogenase
MKKVLLSKAIQPPAMDILTGKVEPVILPNDAVETAKQFVANVAGVILRTNLKLTQEIMDAAPQLKIISRTGVGVDNVDVAAATARGILVCYTPGVNANSVAEQTLALILGVAKQLRSMDKGVREGNWKIRNAALAMDVDGKTLGLVGIGRIGSLVAQKCRLAFNMKVLAYDPYVQEAEGIAICSSLDDVFRQADVVSIHVPYTKETHHLVDARLLSLMKPEACFINTARGAIVDEHALIAVLKNGAIAGAGLDVFEQEPPALDNPLLALDNVVATPHAAALSRECELKVAMTAAQAVVDYFEGRQPKYIYNHKELQLGACV